MKKITSISLIISGFLMLCSGSTFAQEILTLEKALEIAYQQSPSIIQSKMSLEQSELALIQQKASLKSQFSLNLSPFQYTRSTSFDNYNTQWYTRKSMSSGLDFRISQPIKWTDGTLTLSNSFNWQDDDNQSFGAKSTSFSNNLSLNLEQPIFTYNKTKMQLKRLEFNLEKAKIQYALAQLNIEKNVTSAFYGVYQAYKRLVTAREAFQSQKENYELIKNKVEQGLIAQEELFQAEVTLATNENSLADTEMSYENTKDQFKQTLGLPLDIDISILPNIQIDPVQVDVNQAVKYALDQRMEIRQQQIAIEEGIFSLIEAKDNNKFKGSISARVGLMGQGDKFNGAFSKPDDNETIGVTLTVPLWDWGARKANIRSSELSNENTEISNAEERKSIMLDVRQLCRELPKLLRQIDIARQTVSNAERTYDINVEKYRNGALTGMELKNQQTQLTDAKNALTDAIISYKLRLLDLKIQTLWDFQNNKSYLPVDLLK
ncbi:MULTISPECIES: TolC family protein [Odoribacteraceae]|uniref:TolC family protein n=1 Tax=Odoribacteraceae TaxID=1853231 RepID=UPI001F34C0EC|nr:MULTISPECIES: TolC family protein [Odoribacteraceae]MCQ4875361.1 TolC family protein [Butyricimonas paravirosa]